jgi:gas vesicle protein
MLARTVGTEVYTFELEAGQESDMADTESSVSGFGWFLAGLGVGALVGVLYAPKSGVETRSDLAAGALEARDKANALAQQGKERAADIAAQAQARAQDLSEQGKQAAGEYVDKGKEYYEKGRSQFNDYVEKGKGLVQEQQDKVAAAVDAGKQAYTTTTTEQPS